MSRWPAALFLAGFAAGAAAEDPPGPYAGRTPIEELRKTAFDASRPIAGAYYFYWYDIATGAHFVNPDGTDALTRHPESTEGTSYELASWHAGELRAMLDAGLDFLLPVYWGTPGDRESWSVRGLPPLVEAARQLEREGLEPPRIGCFYDTSTLRHNPGGFHADLRTAEGREWLYLTVRDFFSLIPPDLRAAIEGRPLVWLYSAAFAKAQDPEALDTLRSRFRADFGVEPYIVKEESWEGRADATYAWGAALRPRLLDVAAVGPGYDHSAVPGRDPLVRDREGGRFYRRSWEWMLSRPVAERPSVAVVETWNEWHEGTDIAPAKEDGRLYVEITREYTDLWHERRVLPPPGAFAHRLEVSAVLGDPDRSDGLSLGDEPDGRTRAVRASGKSARVTEATRFGGRYMYFDADDSFFWKSGVPVTLEVTFLDEGEGAIIIEYDATDPSAPHAGAFKAAPAIEREGTGAWRTAELRLEDAAFTGRANRNDFRLVDTDGKLAVHRVALRKEAARKAAVDPAPR